MKDCLLELAENTKYSVPAALVSPDRGVICIRIVEPAINSMGEPVYAYRQCPAPHSTPISQSTGTVGTVWLVTYPEYTTLAILRPIPGVPNPNASILTSYKNEQSHLVRLTLTHLFNLNKHTASVRPLYEGFWAMRVDVISKVRVIWAVTYSLIEAVVGNHRVPRLTPGHRSVPSLLRFAIHPISQSTSMGMEIFPPEPLLLAAL